MTVVDSVNRASTYQRRTTIAKDADERQDQILSDVGKDGFNFNWSAILKDGGADTLGLIERQLHEQGRSPDLRRTVGVLGLNGRCLATFVQKRHEEEIGIRRPANILPVEFSELALPDGSIDYWRRTLSLTDDQVAVVRSWLTAFDAQMHEIRSRVTDTLMRRLTGIYSRALTGEGGLQSFLNEARDVMPDASRSLLETEYRTHLSRTYGNARHEQIADRANIFPFTQFFIVNDTRTTWYCCLPMGTAGPNGTGYVAASTDVTWFKFRTPCHFQCRSTHSPIGYREAMRMGILDADGRTKIAVRGNNPERPYGDPPAIATNPNPPYESRRVAPAEGFGGNA